jgi:hypothetical protein
MNVSINKIMKRLMTIALAGSLLVASCKDGYIDDINNVAPGADATAPVVNITYPLQGTLIRVVEDVVPINIEFTVEDDIEIKSILLQLNGTKLAEFTSFKDYRRALQSFRAEQITNGQHTLTVTATDVSGKSTTQTVQFEKVAPYRPIYDGEVLYMPFDGDLVELLTIQTATKVGTSGFASAGKKGSAYQGGTGGYITLPSQGLTGNEFSASFWYKVNATPDRGGLLTMSAPGPTNNNRNFGFRLFRENAGGKQRIKLNVGTGTTDTWFDGGAAADIDPADGQWAHIAFTISGSRAAVYINGQVVSQGNLDGVNWTGADLLSIGSGAPRFTEWNHLSDLSLFDELRIFNKALTQAEIQAIMAD